MKYFNNCFKLYFLFLLCLSHLVFYKIIFYEKISIIIPTYNRGNIILKSIKSCLNQTYNDIEILIIDDGSTDNTESIIKQFKDNKIKYIKLNKNYGASYARNIGIMNSKGKYIAFQDSDDIFHKDKLNKQLHNLKKSKSDMDFCKILVINNNEKTIIPSKLTEKAIINGTIFEELLSCGNFISTQSILVKKSYVEKYLFDTKLPRLQDYDLVLRMVPNIKVSYTNEVLVDLYMQKNSITKSKIKLQNSIKLLLKKNYNFTINQKMKFINLSKSIYFEL